MYTDIELITQARNGDVFAEEALAKRYVNLVRIWARQFFLVGGDGEDLIQEGMFGLIRAIRTYDLEKEASFKTYAEQCIRNRLINVIESAASRKHSPLNGYVSIEELSKSFQGTAEDVFQRSTELMVLSKEFHNEVLQRRMEHLSKLEKKVLELYLTGMSYREIAEASGKTEKSIDNAIQRIRKKLAKDN